MDAIWATIAQKIWDLLWPKLEAFLGDKLDEWLPKIMKTVIAGISTAAGQLVVDSTHKVTDVIPGKVDDAIINPLVEQGMDFLHKTFGF